MGIYGKYLQVKIQLLSKMKDCKIVKKPKYTLKLLFSMTIARFVSCLFYIHIILNP